MVVKLPEIRSFDVQFLGIENGLFALFLVLFVVAEGADGFGREQQDGGDVDPRHRAHPDVAEVPRSFRLLERAVEHRRNDAEAENPYVDVLFPPLPEQVNHPRFGIIVVGHDGGEGEESKGDRHHDVADLSAEQRADGRGCVGNVRRTQIVRRLVQHRAAGTVHYIVGLGGQYHDGGGGAHQQRIDIDGEGLHQSLFHGMRHLGRARHDGTGALSGLVGVDAALHTPRHRVAEDAAEGFVHTECPADHLPEHRRHDRRVANQDDEGQNNVKEGHERCHQFRHAGDALHPANDDQPKYEGGDAADNRWCNADRVGEGNSDAVALNRRHQQTAGDDGADGKNPCQPLAVQSLLYVIRRPATKLAVMFFLVNLRQCRLHESRTRPEESDDPHPYDGARSAVTDGGGDTHDIARPHSPRKRHGKRLKRRDAGFLLLVGGEQQPRHLAEPAHLHEARAYGKVQPRPETEAHQRRAPHPPGDVGDDFFKTDNEEYRHLQLSRFEAAKIQKKNVFLPL